MKRFFQYLCVGLAGGALAFYNIGCGGSGGTSSTTTSTTTIAGTASSGSGTGALAMAPKKGVVETLFAFLNGDINSSELTNRIGNTFTPSANAAFKTGTLLSGATVSVQDLAGNSLGTATTSTTGAWSTSFTSQNLDGYYVETTGGGLTNPIRKVGKEIKSTDTAVSAGDVNESTTAITKVIETIGGVKFPSTAAANATKKKTGSLALGNLVNVFTSAVNNNPTGPVATLIDAIQTNGGTGTTTAATSSFASVLGSNSTLISALTNFNAGAVNANKVAANAGATALTTSQSAITKLENILVSAVDNTAVKYAGDLGNVLASSSTPDTIASSITIETNVLNITTSTIGTTLSSLTTSIPLLAKAVGYVDLTGATNWKKAITITAGAKLDVTASKTGDPSLSPTTANLTRDCATAGDCTYAWSILDSTATALTTAGTTATTATATLDTSTLTAGAYTIRLAVTNGVGTNYDNIPLVVAASTAVIPNVTITAPSLNPWYVNSNSAVTLTASVTDNAGAALTTGVTTAWSILTKPSTSAATLATNATSFTPDAIGTYTLQFKATGDAVATATATITAISGTAPTAAPTGLAATGGTANTPSVSLTWNAVTGANGYYVYRKYFTAPTSTTTSLGSSTATSYTDNAMLTTSYPYGDGYYTVAGFAFTASNGSRTGTATGPQSSAVYCYGYTTACK